MKIVNWNLLSEAQKDSTLARPAIENKSALAEGTSRIINAVKERGDDALYAFTKQYDKAELNNLLVSESEFEAASKGITEAAREAIDLAIGRITAYHKACLPQTICVEENDGIRLERITRPIQRVGLYVPGGTAPLVSTLMMLALPAGIANCPLKIVCTPASKEGEIDPRLLFAAKRCGINNIIKIGGAQAIGAMAYGTASVPKVDKIFGPGNGWVTEAKRQVSLDAGGASIDMPAGPSEVMVIADADANPILIAADLLSQAEHGPDSQVLLLTDTEKLAEAVCAELDKQLNHLSRRKIAASALENGSVILVDKIENAFAIANRYAPEHLILQIKNARNYIDKILCAGAVFLGPWTPETLGDYVTGSNHVLPTYGYASAYSGLCVDDFMTKISIQEGSEAGLKAVGAAAMMLAEIEGLDAHKAAVALRLKLLEEGNE